MSTRDTTHAEPFPEEELYELFRPRRPDADSFGEAVRRRIAERERREERSEPEQGPAWIRRAAAFLPFDPHLLGALGGASVGKVVATKLLPAALSLPVLLLGSAVGAFAAGARSLRRSRDGANPALHEPRRAQRRRTRGRVANRDLRAGGALLNALQFLGLAAVLLAPVLGGPQAIDVLLLVLVLSMGALTLSVRGFAQAGLLARPEVANLSASVLSTVFLSCFLWSASMNVPDSVSELGMGWGALVVLLGALVCKVSTGRSYLWILVVLVMTPLLVVLNPIGVTRTSAASLRAQLAGIALDPEDLENWSEASALHHALTAAGFERPDLTVLAGEVAAAVDAGVDAHPRVWTAALEMGLLDADRRGALAARRLVAHRLQQLREGAGELHLIDYDEYLFWLLRDMDLPRAERDELAARVLESWPEPEEHNALARAFLCVRALDLLGLQEHADGLAPRAHALLEATWIADDVGLFGKLGGFTSNPSRFRTSFDDQTWNAVRLMERLGVPEGMDLRLLRGHLRTESRAVLLDLQPELHAWSRASLFLVEERLGLPPRSPLQRVLDERMLIASLLLVALCMTAVRLAPPPGGAPGPGALP